MRGAGLGWWEFLVSVVSCIASSGYMGFGVLPCSTYR